jgi:hypothetical protein
LFDLLLANNSAVMVECVDFPWHFFLLGAVKCFRNHFAYSCSVEVGYTHFCSFVFGFYVIAYSALNVGDLFIYALFFFFSSSL